MNAPPVIWSVAGTDSGGGAGLAADQRAADAFGLHLGTVVAAITAQSTTEVSLIAATAPALLQAQLDTLARDMPPRVIKTGLLGSADNVRVLAAFVDRLRAQQPVALVVDPVLRASTGAALADAELHA
ncbi:bifunctional hydroxymethylpyrimidine kinase/phosphomethylpyrimidine kinase, partial [Hydrogenophaga electricum]|uniref:bifunctional hydroxymethylpyrimidine kinase/phosphomethylpyrimidine kinase n=1 Tax=Hydrogenophaga electricum TaxID=1230953 RepID=UPI0024E0E06F